MKKKYILIGIGIIFVGFFAGVFFFLKTILYGKKVPFSDDYWAYYDLPDLTMKQRKEFCKKSPQEKETYWQDGLERGQDFSDKLENYIRLWLEGKASAQLPKGLLPPSIDNEKTKNWTLLKPEEVDPQKQWMELSAHVPPEDFSALHLNSPDTNATYLKALFIAPLDSKLLAEGDFPWARFFSYQILEPFDPKFPVTGNMGQPEVPIVDVDIEPDPGNVNPYRIGANRNAVNRYYHVSFDLKAGNSLALNPQAMKAPEFRALGNNRVGGPFGFSGPWGESQLVASVLWIRIFAPDKNAFPTGGVGYPKLLLQLKTGEKFWLQPDFSLAAQRWSVTIPGAQGQFIDPVKVIGPNLGWFKLYGTMEAVADATGYMKSWPYGIWPPQIVKKQIRDDFTCLFNRDASLSPPGNIETAATFNDYASYLVRPLMLGDGKVYTLTGRLPTTPQTRNSENTMEKAEARYWSLCHVGQGEGKKYKHYITYGCLMDDEIVTDNNRDFIIIYSQKKDRPSNARPECGVTWQDFGGENPQAFNIRWISVRPDHFMSQYSPHLENLPWEKSSWSQDKFDKKLVSENKPGVMGPYQPIIHYLTKAEFESLSCPVDPNTIPEWK